MRLYRLVGVRRHGDGTYREKGGAACVLAKHVRQAREIMAREDPTPRGAPNPWHYSAVTRCVPVPGAHVRGKRAGLVRA